MKVGDIVVYLADVGLYGLGEIRGIHKNGRLAVDFDGQIDSFDAQELELASLYYDTTERPAAKAKA